MKPKFAFTVNTPDTRAKALAWSGDPEAVFTKLHDMGYDGVELFVRDPRELDPERFRQLLARTALTAVVVGTGQLLAEDRLFFTHDDAKVRTETLTRMKAVIDFAAELQSQVNTGKIRGDLKGDEQRKAWRDDAFRELGAYARAKNVIMTIEPQNRFGCDNLNTTQESLEWLRRMNVPNLKLMLDVFHMQIDDACMAASFVEAADMCVHVHFADTNRGAPGTGSIDFALALRMLKALRYERFISLEIKQTPDSETAAKRALEYVRALVDAVWR